MPAGLLEDIEEWAENFPKFIDELEALLNENRIFKQRTVDVGVVSAKDAKAWGFSGPMLRDQGCLGIFVNRSPIWFMMSWILIYR